MRNVFGLAHIYICTQWKRRQCIISTSYSYSVNIKLHFIQNRIRWLIHVRTCRPCHQRFIGPQTSKGEVRGCKRNKELFMRTLLPSILPYILLTVKDIGAMWEDTKITVTSLLFHALVTSCIHFKATTTIRAYRLLSCRVDSEEFYSIALLYRRCSFYLAGVWSTSER